MPIEQSGNITPGHVAIWTTTGVIADGGSLKSSQTVLATLLSADFNSITDQPLQLPSTINAFAVTGIAVTNSAVSLTTAQGGFYPQAAKGGTPLVASTQAYSSLTGVTKLLNCTLAAGIVATRYDRTSVPDWIIYLSLTTAQGIAASADCYLLGIDLTA